MNEDEEIDLAEAMHILQGITEEMRAIKYAAEDAELAMKAAAAMAANTDTRTMKRLRRDKIKDHVGYIKVSSVLTVAPSMVQDAGVYIAVSGHSLHISSEQADNLITVLQYIKHVNETWEEGLT